jgi:hypothetical protein
VHQLWKIEPELVPFALGVGTLDFAELALEAGVHDGFSLICGNASDVAVILVVQQREEGWKAVAVLEAEAAAVTYLERALHFFVKSAGFPVFLLRGVVRDPVGRLIRDVLFVFHAGERLESAALTVGRRRIKETIS